MWRWPALQWLVTDRLVECHGKLLSIFSYFLCDSAGKESACNAGDLGLIPGLGRSPEEGKGYPLQYSDLENTMYCISMGLQNRDVTEWLSLFITSLLSFLIAELLFRNFCFLQSGVVISLSLFCQILLILSTVSISCDYLGFLLCFSFPLAPIRVRDTALVRGLLPQSPRPVCRFVSCFYLAPFLPFSVPVSTGSGYFLPGRSRTSLFCAACLKKPLSVSVEILTLS